MALRFGCSIDDCTCSYVNKSSLKDHQIKKHKTVFEKSGIQMKRVSVATATPDDQSKRLKTANVDLGQVVPIAAATAEIPPNLGAMWQAIERVDARLDSITADISRLSELMLKLSNDGESKSIKMMNELNSEVFAHVTDLRQQMTLVAKKNTKWCIVCFERENDYAFMPCRHKCVCKQCAQNVLNNYKKCPICRVAITTANMIYDLSAWENESGET
jgi:hypothetical protein